MSVNQEVKVELSHEQIVTAILVIRLLQKDVSKSASILLDLRNHPERDLNLDPVQLIEGAEYTFEIQPKLRSLQSVSCDRADIFEPDDSSGKRGRIKTGLNTGMLRVKFWTQDGILGKTSFEVRSRKLDYVKDYRWMIRDVANGFTEIIMDRFAPTEQKFTIDLTKDASTLYQRFAFLQSLLDDFSFEMAINQILSHPHRMYEEYEEERRPGQGIPSSSEIVRQITVPGPRIQFPSKRMSNSLPRIFKVKRTEVTLDNVENRFVKFALSRWREVVSQIKDVLEKEVDSAPKIRGLRECDDVLFRLNALLSQQMFREVGMLTQFPTSSQVLQKKDGYRDIFRTYIQFEAAALLSWEGGDDVYGAGQRDVATLYEFWSFLQLATIVSQLCNEPFEFSTLIEVSPRGLNVNLRSGVRKVLHGTAIRSGRRINLELWFNRSFSTKSADAGHGRDRCGQTLSLRLWAKNEYTTDIRDVWLHFDSKYRVQALSDLFGTSDYLDYEDEKKRGIPKRSDLLKMHAYRDAIRRSVGAYVLYPGSETEECWQYGEILPGLGAFALRPTEVGDAEGTHKLLQFIEDCLQHLASQLTQHERLRFWSQRVYSKPASQLKISNTMDYLKVPAEDTLVLLGFVKSIQHLEWIHKQMIYNLRADDRSGSVGLQSPELSVDLVLLYGEHFEEVEVWIVNANVELFTKQYLLSRNYPKPQRRSIYLFRASR